MTLCTGCRRPVIGQAVINGAPYCHPDVGLDCYHQATVGGWGRAQFDQWLARREGDAVPATIHAEFLRS